MSVFNPIFEAMGTVLSWLYAIVPNYGIAIILLTILVRLVLYPLTAKQARSMIAMQRVQPEIKKLQAKYKDDKQKLNEEMMKFYKENKINPFGGCLPLLAQMPIFISLFRVLHDPQKYVPKDSTFYEHMCRTASCKVPQMDFFGMNLSSSAGGHHSSFAAALPYWLLVGGVVVTAYLQQRQTMKNSPGAQNQQAQIIGKVMPLVFAFISINLPAGVVLYFFVSNLWQMGQQELIIRKMDAAPAGVGSKAVVDAKSTEAAASGGFLVALHQARDRQRRGERRRGSPRRRGERQGRSTLDHGQRRQGGRGEARAAREARRFQARGLEGRGLQGGGIRGRPGYQQPATQQQEAAAVARWSGSRQPEGRWRKRSSSRSISSGVLEDEVEFEVLVEPKAGLFGRFGGTEARLRARVKPVSREKPGERRRGRKPRKSGGSGSGDGGSRPARGNGSPGAGGGAAARSGDDEGPKPRRRRGGRNRSSGGGGENRPTANGGASRRPAHEGDEQMSDEPEISVEEQSEAAEEFTRGLVEAFGFDAAVSSSVDDEILLVEVNGENLGLLVGPRGATLHAIEELVRTVVQRRTGGHGMRIHVDVAGYRAKRREALAAFTRQLVEKVLESGREQVLDPMPPPDRKVVHDTVGEFDGVETASEGEEPRRRVVIRAT